MATLTDPLKDFPAWYQDILLKAELADSGPVRGTMVIRPYAYGIWELMQAELDKRIKATGTQNAYFPLLIPSSYLEKEAQHIEGFSPELAVVTHAGGKDLEEPVVIRPTSETIIGEYMAKWINSYRDLPLLLNQWANVVRWEKRSRIFLRTTEFLWQEGHTAHATEEDAATFAKKILHDVYADFIREELAIPAIVGRKTAAERFAGATNSMTCEAMMGDGKALQVGTSHELGQNFSKAFDIKFQGQQDDAEQLAWTTSWGVSTRLLGGLIMTHGDSKGLRLPPRVAPIQCVIIPVDQEALEHSEVKDINDRLVEVGVRPFIDVRVERSFGRRVTEWELKGVPVRIVLGKREMSSSTLSISRRDTGTTEEMTKNSLLDTIKDLLVDIQKTLSTEAATRQSSATVEASSIEEAITAGEKGFARIPWKALGEAGEAKLAERALTVRCLVSKDAGVPNEDSLDEAIAIVSRAY